ncbi:MAG: DUF3267 domain-containing protein [Prolixibacteraceae bacterium]|nr:DUF3267 domain-containing protein [Prolixibacteraceae bacterium]
MSRNNNTLSPDDLVNNERYTLIRELEYHNIKPFILEEIGKKRMLIIAYSILQILALAFIVFKLSFYAIGLISDGIFKQELLVAGLAFLFSFTVLIIVHELMHAAAFFILGKKNIGFGMQLKKFIFYTEVHRQVMSGKELVFVALAPFVAVTIGGLLLWFFNRNSLWGDFSLFITLIHLFFCAGDMALVSFRAGFKGTEIYTWDDREKKKTYYYKETENI